MFWLELIPDPATQENKFWPPAWLFSFDFACFEAFIGFVSLFINISWPLVLHLIVALSEAKLNLHFVRWVWTFSLSFVNVDDIDLCNVSRIGGFLLLLIREEIGVLATCRFLFQLSVCFLHVFQVLI